MTLSLPSLSVFCCEFVSGIKAS